MDKIYSGNARIIQTQYGPLTKVSQSKKDLETLLKYVNDNNLEWVTSVIKEKQEKVEGKPTHFLQVDEWKPNAQPTEKKQYNPTVAKNEMPQKFQDDALPF